MTRLATYQAALRAIADGAPDAPAVARQALDASPDHDDEWRALLRDVAALPPAERRHLVARVEARGVRGPGER